MHITSMRDLAYKICVFMVGIDLYSFKDNYNSFSDFVTETLAGLYDERRRKGIADDLKVTAENFDDDETASEASMLYRKVMSL